MLAQHLVDRHQETRVATRELDLDLTPDLRCQRVLRALRGYAVVGHLRQHPAGPVEQVDDLPPRRDAGYRHQWRAPAPGANEIGKLTRHPPTGSAGGVRQWQPDLFAGVITDRQLQVPAGVLTA